MDRQVTADAGVPTAEEMAQEEAAFEATFNDTDHGPEDVNEPEAEAVPEVESKPEEPGEPATPPLTVDDLKAMIESERAESQRRLDTVFGKIGNLQQKIDAARTSAIGISPKAKERLAADFPELAEMLFDGTEESSAPVAQQAYTAPQMPDVQDVIRREVEPLKLSVTHPDWEGVVQSKDFLNWKQSVLDPNVASELDNSWDAKFVSGKITEFKKWREAQAAQAQAAQKRQDRLDAAITPRGVPRAGTGTLSDDDEEAMMMKSYGRK